MSALKDRIYFKALCLFVAFSFLFIQLIDPAFAQELKSNLSEKCDETGTKRTYDSTTNQLIKTELSNGTIVNYENGKVRQIVDSLGNVIADYIYDANSNLFVIILTYAREKLKSSVEEASAGTLKERDDALLILEKAIQDAIALVESQYAGGMVQAQVVRARLYSYTIDPNYDISQELLGVEKYENGLRQARDKALIDIENERLQKTQEILTKTEDALNRLLSWQADILNLIVYEEISTLLNTYYKTLFGKAPSNDEMAYWQSRALSGEEVTGTTISSYLESSNSEKLEIREIRKLGTDTYFIEA